MTVELKDRKQLFGFIPHRLEIEGRPELNDFPLNVLFANFFRARGVDFSATALYEPDLETYRNKGEERSLVYRNIYNSENEIKITRHEDKWEGVKKIKGEEVLFASGQTWKQFFVHLTASGLINGERCKFERLELKDEEIN